VGNLPKDANEEALRLLFAEHGQVAEVHVVVDRYTGRSRGFAFVTMASEEQARLAAAKMSGTTLGGHVLKVNEAPSLHADAPRRQS
jgi:cold-inducible RNA-binding protein